MADTKITALTAISTVDPAVDVLPIVDVSDTTMAASGTTKKITSNQILGAGGTATLASATITGDLTVDTSTLKVDSANNRVGIGTATPARPLDIVGSFQSTLGWVLTGTPAGLGAATRYIGGASTTDSWYYNAVSGGSHVWAFGESESMRLNSTGLGVGVSPSYNLDVRAAAATANVQSSTGTNAVSIVARNTGGSFTLGKENSVGGGSGVFGQDAYASVLWSTGAYPIAFGTNGSQRMLIDSSGNVGIGITPAAKLHVEQSGPQARFSTASATDARHEYYRNGIREGLLYWDANLIGLYATQSSGELVLASANTIRVRINSAGDTISNVTATAPTLTTNRQMVFNLTSDTNLRISVRGSDGTTRTANITLA